jgi:flagellar motor switch protein FliN/FliY
MAPETTPGGQNPEEIQATEGAVAADIQVTAQEKAQGKSGKMQAEAKAAQFSPVQDSGKSSVQRGLDFILDIPLQITVELGRAQMLINDLLQLGQGSVVELSKLAGEPMEVLVNQKLIARGEVVVVNEKFGIRLTDIISPLERVEQLS